MAVKNNLFFNNANLKSVLSKFHQHVDFATRGPQYTIQTAHKTL